LSDRGWQRTNKELPAAQKLKLETGAAVKCGEEREMEGEEGKGRCKGRGAGRKRKESKQDGMTGRERASR
jgi:hypothetical protein